MRPDCRATLGCAETMVGAGNRAGLPPSRAMRQSELFPLPAEPANRISRPSAVQSRPVMSHTPDVICFGGPEAAPSRLSGITNTPELKVLVRRTKASVPLSGDRAGEMSIPAAGLVSWRTSPPSDETANSPCPAPVKTKKAPPGDHARSPLVAPFDIETRVCPARRRHHVNAAVAPDKRE